ncbi:MAG: HAD-IA family hydrolase, partial [Clostridia bacterium]|nr:HAD-IA family hydrolase [Clostridia bacterium]
RLYIVTNGIKRVQSRRCEKSGFSKIFDGIFISEEVGFNKPDPRFFEHVATHVENFDKAKTLVVGDSLSSDIKGGAGFGLDTVWFAPDATEDSELATYTIRRLCELNSIIFTENTDERA